MVSERDDIRSWMGVAWGWDEGKRILRDTPYLLPQAEEVGTVRCCVVLYHRARSGREEANFVRTVSNLWQESKESWPAWRRGGMTTKYTPVVFIQYGVLLCEAYREYRNGRSSWGTRRGEEWGSEHGGDRPRPEVK